MNNIIVISALVLMSSMASAVTVRGNGRYYTGTLNPTVKEACAAATQAAKNSLSEKCGFISGTIASEAKVVLEPQAGKYESYCTAYVEADCQ